MSRWVPLYATSNSGKTLFVCLMCGRVSPLPDKVCPVPPVVPSWKFATTCAVLEELEDAAFEAGERHVRLNERIMVGVARDGTAVAQWQSKSGDCHRVDVKIHQEKHDTHKPRSGPRGIPFERTPDGDINNCSLANCEDEKTCQICNGHCPDRHRFP